MSQLTTIIWRYYAKNSLNGNCIAKTNGVFSDITPDNTFYYFDAVEGTDNQFYIYTIDENGSKIIRSV